MNDLEGTNLGKSTEPKNRSEDDTIISLAPVWIRMQNTALMPVIVRATVQPAGLGVVVPVIASALWMGGWQH